MEVLTPAEMDKADQLAIASGVSSFALMMSAGCQVAQAALDMAGSGSILVVCGRGNNGGDGFVAASELRRSGREVAVMLLCDRASLTGDAATAAANWAGDVLPFDPAQIGHPALIIDAIFGAGLNRAVKGDPESIIAAINDSGAPVLSVDLPSGVNGASGAVMGLAIRATETVTFFRHKPGHLLLPGRSHCGRVRLVDIGIASEVLREIRPATFENRPDLWERQFPIPTAEGHKYARGHAIVVSGGVASTGAARLCARGALRIGAGLVTLASPRDALAVNAAALTAIMLHPADTPGELSELLSDKRLNACAIGPGAGVGGATSEKVLAILQRPCAVVLDADALSSFAGSPQKLFDAIRARPKSDVVLTPHEGEFPRLFSDMSNKSPFKSKLERGRAAALRSGAVVLLKGADTVVASPDGRAAIASNAPPWLATAGAGDVLAGMIAGLLAQRVPMFEAACAGNWMHGEAAREAGPGLIAEDLPEVLPAVIRRLYDELGVAY